MADPQGVSVAAAVIGNGLEFYDFITYATFAVPIGQAFFPSITLSLHQPDALARDLWRRFYLTSGGRDRDRALC